MRYGLDELLRSFGLPVVERAREYVELGSVSVTGGGAGASRLFGLVRPSGRSPLRVMAQAEPRSGGAVELSGACSCGAGRNCEHVAAVLLSGLGAEALAPERWRAIAAPRGGREAGRRSAPRVTRPTAAVRDFETERERSAVRAWLDRLAAAVRGGDEPAGERARVKHRLLYLLDSDPRTRRLTVHPCVAYLRKDGRYGSLKHCAYDGGPSRPDYLGGDDRELLPMIQALSAGHWRASSFYSPVAIDEHAGARLLARLLETGRCHWQSHGTPPLRAGEPRAASIEWQLDAAGRQRPCLVVGGAPWAVGLAVEPPWYVDPREGVAGPLELALEPRATAALLEAPALSPEAVELVRKTLEEGGLLDGIPLPHALEVSERVAAPVPHLRLLLHRPRALPGAWRPPGPLPLAELTFDYGGVRVSFGDEGAVLQRLVEDRLIRVRRDRAAEERAARCLSEMDFVELSEVAFPGELEDAPPGAFVPLDEADSLDGFLVEFSRQQVPALREAGWTVSFDEDWPFRIVVDDDVEWYAGVEEGTNPWFDLELGVEIDGERLSLLEPLVEMLRDPAFDPALWDRGDAAPGDELALRLADGRLLVLPAERVRVIVGTLTELFGERPLTEDGLLRMSSLNAPRLDELDAALGQGRLAWVGGAATRELGRKLRGFAGVEPVAVPRGFVGELRAYQRHGLDWLQFLREHDLAGVLADDMGLGKTVQVLAHLLVEKEAGRADRPSLVVAPTSVIPNWRREAERFAPDLSLLVLHGQSRKRHFEGIGDHDLVLTTYPLLSRDEEALTAGRFHALILDEAQFVKNAKTKASLVARRIEARHRLCLTGTPMENHLGELWSLFHILMPGFLGDAREFRRLFRTPIEKHGDVQRREQLAARLAPFMLRRTKDEVETDLPPKSEMTRTVELGRAQRDLYESIRLAMNHKVRREIARKGLERSTIVILDALLKLRQVCCDPRLLALKESKRVQDSAKLDELMRMLDEMLQEGRRVLLFSQFTSMIALIERELRARKLDWVRLTGSTRDRETPVRRFQSGEVPLFLISLKAGGTGLNLTAADTVVHYDPWWNPAVEDQATDRAHRIGQDKPIFVYRLIVAGSVEEKMLALQARKRALASGIYRRGGAKAGAPLSAEDLEALFQPLDPAGSTP